MTDALDIAYSAYSTTCDPEMYSTLLDTVRKQAMRQTGDEDIAQDTVIRVIQYLDRYDPAKAPFHRWCSRLISNAARDAKRDQQRYLTTDPGDIDATQHAPASPEPSRRMREIIRLDDTHMASLIAEGHSATDAARMIGRKPEYASSFRRKIKNKFAACSKQACSISST